MSRLRVFQWRLAASGALLLLLFVVIRLLWYPGAYFAISGAREQLLILAGVMFVVGPVLSTFVYKQGKKALVMDLSILAAVELAAVVAATVLIFQRQPWFAVYAVDRFEAISRGEVVLDESGYEFATTRPLDEPRLVYAKLPEDPKALDKLINETVFQGMADIDRRPEFWHPYDDGLSAVLEAARPLHELNLDEQGRAAIAEWLQTDAEQLLFLPLRGRKGDATMIIDGNTGRPLASVAVDPW